MLFKSIIANEMGSSSVIDASRLGVFSLEGRYYLKKKHNTMQGFHVVPFVKYGRSNVNTSVDYSLTPSIQSFLPFLGNYNAFSTGVQWMLVKQFLLDWRIIGLGYGHFSGSLLGRRDISSEAQKEILQMPCWYWV